MDIEEIPYLLLLELDGELCRDGFVHIYDRAFVKLRDQEDNRRLLIWFSTELPEHFLTSDRRPYPDASIDCGGYYRGVWGMALAEPADKAIHIGMFDTSYLEPKELPNRLFVMEKIFGKLRKIFSSNGFS